MLKRKVLIPVILLMAFKSQAQCDAASTRALSYDTTVNALGNSYYDFTFPQFNPTLGTLLDVKINTKVTLVYNFRLENGEINPVNNYRVKVFRDDEINGSALRAPLTNSYQKQYGPFLLAGADALLNTGLDFIQQGPLYVMNQQNISYTLSNTADFLGTSAVMFDYATSTYSAAQGSINNRFDGSAQDLVKFNITYSYCPQIILAADITSFKASKVNDAVIDIKWITQNEKNNRKYELQKSTDGKTFRGVAQFTATTTQTGTYSYSYAVQPTDNNQTVIFRVKQMDESGTAKYSAVNAVKLTNKTGSQPVIYPNPAQGAANLLFSTTKRNNWEVSVYSVGGQLMKRYNFNNALTGKINTAREFEKGIYMVRSLNKSTQEQFVEQLFVQ